MVGNAGCDDGISAIIASPARALRQARRRADLSQRDLSARTGVPQSTIGRIEASLVDPRVSTLDRLLRACGDELDAVPRRGIGVDRTLSQDLLRHPVPDRIDQMARASRGVARLRDAFVVTRER